MNKKLASIFSGGLRIKHRIFISIIFLFLLFSGFGITAQPVAATTDVTATSGSASAIQAAANTVYAAGGGTVRIPAGNFNLSGSVTIRDNVKLIGAGIGVTILRSGGSDVLRGQGNNIRFSGFSLITTSTSTSTNGLKIDPGVDFRVDHLYIEGFSWAGVYVDGINSRGVIDHCTIKMMIVSDLGYGVLVMRKNYWEADMHLGTAQATFIENCTIINARHAVAANQGGHYVFRYNLVQQGSVGHQVDGHGVGFGSTEGTRAIEVYDNVIENPVSGNSQAVSIRGGGGVVYDNTIRGYKYSVCLMVESDQVGQPYPIKDQVAGLYLWNNQHNGSGAEVVVASSPDSRSYIQQNRDYFLYAKSGYTPYTYPHPLTVGGGSTNNPPVLAAIGNRTVNEGQALTFTISATDPNGDSLTYSASNLPSGATFTPATRTFAWTPGYTQAATYTNVHFLVSDGSLTDSEDISITVNNANRAPVLAAIGNKTVSKGQALTFTISATDPDGNTLTYSASNLPSGATFTPATRTFTWTPSSSQNGTYPNVHFQVSDGSLIASENITITVSNTNQAPVLGPIGNKSVNEGQVLTFTISATDPNGDSLTYTASNLPSGGTFTPATRTFTWTPSYSQAGTYTNDHFLVSDGSLTDSEDISITVNNANRSPVLAAIGNKTVSEGQTLTFTISATDPDGDTLTYSASNLPSGATFAPATRTFTWTPSSSQASSYPNVHFQVSDGSLIASENITITVSNTNQAPVAMNDSYATAKNTTLNISAPGVLSNDTDLDSANLTSIKVTNPSHGSVTFNSNGSFSYVPATNFTGSDSFTYKANDGALDSNTATVSITVTGSSSATFGLNSGNGNYDESNSCVDAMRFQNTAGTGNLAKLEVLFDDTSPQGHVRMGVYADNNGAPGALLLDAGTVNVANGWVSISGLNLPVTANTYYWLVFNLDSGNIVRTQTGPANSHYWLDTPYGPLPNPYPQPTGIENTNFVMRATVNIGG